jgi:hypothetical protein
MAFLPIGPPESQETMFEEPSGYAATDEYPSEEFAELESEIQVERVEREPEPARGPYYLPGHEQEHESVLSSAIHSEDALETTARSISETPLETSPEPKFDNQPGHRLESRSEIEADSDPEPSTLTVDDFSALEDRVVRAVSLVRRERLARVAAEERANKVQAELDELSLSLDRVTQLQQEVDALRAEREQVRQRVERLLSQLDALEL